MFCSLILYLSFNFKKFQIFAPIKITWFYVKYYALKFGHFILYYIF